MKRLLTWAAIAVALAAGLLAAAYAGRDRLFAARLEALIRETLREETGLEISIGSVSGSYLRDLEIREIRTLRPSPAGPIARLAAQRIRLRYSLPALVGGLNEFISATTVDAESLYLDIDLDQWEAAGRPAPAGSDAGAGLPAALPALRLHEATIVLRSQDVRVRCEGGSLEVLPAAGQRITLALSVPRIEAGRRLHPDDEIERALAGELHLQANSSWPPKGLESASGRMSLRFSGRSWPDGQPVHAEVAAALNHGRLWIDRFDLAAARSRAVVTQAEIPWSAIAAGEAWPLLQAASGAFSLFTDDLPRLLAAAGVTTASGMHPAPDHHLALEGRLDAGALTVSQADFVSDGATIRLERLETRLDPDTSASPLAAALTVDAPDLSSISSIFNGPPIEGSLQARVVLSGTLGSPQGRTDLTARRVAIGRSPVAEVRLSATAGQQQVEIGSCEVTSGDDRLSLRGRYDITAHALGAVKLELTASDIAPYLAAFGATPPALSGRTVLNAEGSGPLMQPDFKLEGYLERARLGEADVTGTRIRATGAGGRIRVETIESLTPIGNLRLAGTVVPDTTAGAFAATLERLDIQGDLSLTLTRPAFLRYTPPGTLTIADFEAAGPQGGLAAQGTLSLKGISDLSLRLSEVSGRGWLAKRVGAPIRLAGLNATLRAAGRLGSPDISAVGSIQELGMENTAGFGTARFDLAYSGDRLRIQNLTLAGAEGETLHITGVLPVDPAASPALGPGPLTLKADLRIPDQERMRALIPAWPFVSGSMGAELAVSGTWQAPAARLQWTGRHLAPSDAYVLPPGPYEARGEASLQDRRLKIESLTLSGSAAALEARGELSDVPRWPDLLAGQAGEHRGRVSLTAALRIADLGWASRALEGVRRTAGQIEADIVLEGPLEDPRLTADIRLMGGEVRPEAGLPPLHRLELTAALRDRRLAIHSLQGELGGAPFEITGALQTDRISGQQADFELKGDNLLLFRSETVTLRADARLRLSGPVSGLKLEGEAAITDGRLSTRWRFLDSFLKPGRPASESGLRLFSIQTPPFRDMQFQVRVSSRAPFQVRTNVARGEVRPELLLAGTGEVPILTGVVYVDPGRLSLPSTHLRIDSGLIRFREAEPERPVVDLVGSGRVYGYDITLRVEGPYDAPEIFLASVPPLAHEELLLMLLTGQPPRDAAGMTESQQAGMKVAVFVGRDVLTRWLESALPESDESLFDRLEVEVGKSLSRTGQQTVDAQFRLAEGFIRRGDTLYLTGERDVFDSYNAGVRLVFRFK
ncbi:MAG: translocation/assembly module TamB domain-containing protein [Desulfobacterales bacterium]